MYSVGKLNVGKLNVGKLNVGKINVAIFARLFRDNFADSVRFFPDCTSNAFSADHFTAKHQTMLGLFVVHLSIRRAKQNVLEFSENDFQTLEKIRIVRYFKKIRSNLELQQT